MTDQELYTRAHELLEYKDGQLFWKFSRTRAKKGTKAGCIKEKSYIVITIDGKLYFAHRLIFLMHHGFLPNVIDHINRNGLDNRLENLRQATHKDNSANRRIHKSNTTGIAGVGWDKNSAKWRARIQRNNKLVCLGLYEDKNLAIAARKKAEEKFFGAFAPE